MEARRVKAHFDMDHAVRGKQSERKKERKKGSDNNANLMVLFVVKRCFASGEALPRHTSGRHLQRHRPTHDAHQKAKAEPILWRETSTWRSTLITSLVVWPLTSSCRAESAADHSSGTAPWRWRVAISFAMMPDRKGVGDGEFKRECRRKRGPWSREPWSGGSVK